MHTRRLGIIAAVFAASCVAEGVRAQTPAPPPPAAAAISGIVTDMTTHQPIANAMVTRSGGTGDRVLTDTKGRFLFRSLPNGSYILTATKAGYFEVRYGAKDGRPPKPIPVVAGQWVADARIELVRPGSITGTILDEAGEPVVGALVRALGRPLIAGLVHLVATESVHTDDRGRYRLSGLRPGSYLVEVPSVQSTVLADPSAAVAPGGPPSPPTSAEDTALDLDPANRLVVGTYVTPPLSTSGASMVYPIAFYPGGSTVAEATPVDVAIGQERAGVDLQVRPVRAVRLAGRIDGPPGVTAGLLLRLVPTGLEELGLGGEAATTIADKDGRFMFLNVPVGRYTLDARRTFTEFRYRPAGSGGATGAGTGPTPGTRVQGGGSGTVAAAPEGVEYAYTNVTGDRSMWGRSTLEVTDRDLPDVSLALHPTATLSGRVVWEASNPTNAARMTAESVLTLSLQPADGSASLGVLSGVSAGGNGAFSISGMLAGKYVIRAGLGGVKSVTWNGQDYTNLPFDGSAGQDFANVIVTMTDQTITLSGTVANIPAGDDGAAVIAFPVEKERWSNYGFSPRRLASATVASNGTYSLSTLPAGDYFVIAVGAAALNAWRDPKFLDAASQNATRVTLTWGDDKQQDLRVSEVR